MKRDVRVNVYFSQETNGEPRWSVSQTFPKSDITSGHEVVLRKNFVSHADAQEYADRVSLLGFEHAQTK